MTQHHDRKWQRRSLRFDAVRTLFNYYVLDSAVIYLKIVCRYGYFFTRRIMIKKKNMIHLVLMGVIVGYCSTFQLLFLLPDYAKVIIRWENSVMFATTARVQCIHIYSGVRLLKKKSG